MFGGCKISVLEIVLYFPKMLYKKKIEVTVMGGERLQEQFQAFQLSD
jgi:hypothetical protein